MVGLLLAALGVYYAWALARCELDPDGGLFLLPACTGSWWGRDYVDCKSPAVHVWFWLLSRIVGSHERRIRVLHRLMLNGLALGLYAATGNPVYTLAVMVWANSGWLLAWHGNVGDVTVVLLAWGLAGHWWAWPLAVLYEPKLAPSLVVAYALNGWWRQGLGLALTGAVAAGTVRWVWPQVWAWLVEGLVTLPRAMVRRRGVAHGWTPWYSAQPLLFALPWLVAGVWARPDLLYWLPALVYALVMGLGRVVRPMHLLPLGAWVALAGIGPAWVLALAATDWVSGGLYLGSLWVRFYPGLAQAEIQARKVGRYLRDKPGSLWVNGMDTQIHVYSGKPVTLGMTQQLEMVGALPARTERFLRELKAHPPEWVVDGPNAYTAFNPRGYREVARTDDYRVYHKQ